MTKRSLLLLVGFCTALAAACGGDNGVGLKPAATEPPPEPVLTRLEVTPDSSFLWPGDEQELTIDAWDQFGASLFHSPGGDSAGEATYISSDSAVARVADGVLTGLAPGVARITASLTIANRTRTDSITVRVSTPPTGSGTIVRMNQNTSWSPADVSLKAPATVTWVIPDGMPAPTIWLNVTTENPQKLEFVQGHATRTFSIPGSYYYGPGGLTWNETAGVVRVF